MSKKHTKYTPISRFGNESPQFRGRTDSLKVELLWNTGENWPDAVADGISDVKDLSSHQTEMNC